MRKIIDENVSCLSWLGAGVYSVICSTNSALSIASKVASTALLTVLGARCIPAEKNALATTSFFFHCVGDLLIEVSPQSIEYAMLAFLIGHAFYIRLLNQNRLSPSELSRPRLLMMSGMTLYGAAFTQLLMSKTKGVVQCAIPVYVAALTIMFLLASMQRMRSKEFFLSALMYVASDNLIGAREFLSFRFFGLNQLTWGLYYAGQRGMLNALLTEDKDTFLMYSPRK